MATTASTTPVELETRLSVQALTAEHAYRLDHGRADTLHELYSADGGLLRLSPRDPIGRLNDLELEEVRPGFAPTGIHSDDPLNIDVFAPVRDDYPPLCEHQGYGS